MKFLDSQTLQHRILDKPLGTEEVLDLAFQYYHDAIGDIEKATEAAEIWRLSYPRVFRAHNYLGICYTNAGHLEKALDAYAEAKRRTATRRRTLTWLTHSCT